MEFKVGDRVRIKIGAARMGFPQTAYMSRFEGNTGVVISLGVHSDTCGVRIDGIPDKKWWWQARALEPVTEANIPKPTWRIIIEGDENTSRAKYIVGKTVVKEASAKRYHKDKHDPAMAAAVLVNKMFPDEKEPEKPKYFTGRVVCVECPEGIRLTVGKIYEINDGRMECDQKFVEIEKITSVKDLISKCKPGIKFIEIKE